MIGAPAVAAVSTAYMRVPDSDETRALSECLTPAERARTCAVRSETRRREHIASRVLAKHLVLCGVQADARMHQVGATDLSQFTAAQYRDIEVLRTDGAPRAFSCGVALPNVHLSIAHAAGVTAAAMSADTPIGVDVATVEEHPPSFQRVHFTQCEREWVAGGANATRRELFTILWTLKECAIKAGAEPGATLWGYDEVEVVVGATAPDVADGLRAGASVTTTIRLPNDRVGSASITRIADAILSSVAGIQEA